MKRIIALATAGLFFLGLGGAWAQKEVEPPAVPPLLEQPRPLAQPDPKETATAPKKVEVEKTKPGAKTAKSKPKAVKKAKKQSKSPKVCKKNGAKIASKKKNLKSSKKKAAPVAPAAAAAGPDEG